MLHQSHLRHPICARVPPITHWHGTRTRISTLSAALKIPRPECHGTWARCRSPIRDSRQAKVQKTWMDERLLRSLQIARERTSSLPRRRRYRELTGLLPPQPRPSLSSSTHRSLRVDASPSFPSHISESLISSFAVICICKRRPFRVSISCIAHSLLLLFFIL